MYAAVINKRLVYLFRHANNRLSLVWLAVTSTPAYYTQACRYETAMYVDDFNKRTSLLQLGIIEHNKLFYRTGLYSCYFCIFNQVELSN